MPLQIISCSILHQHLERVSLTRRNKWLIKQHRRNRSFIAKYLEDSSQMQNTWYKQDICYNCSEYTQIFKWFESEGEFIYFQNFVRKGLICKRQTHLGPNNLECACSALTISNIKWICFNIYRPPNSQNLVHFFNDLSNSLSKANESYETFIVMGDVNIYIGISNSDHDKLVQFCGLFNLQSLIKKETFITKKHKSTTELILTNN